MQKSFVNFYSANIVDESYSRKVDEMTSVVVNDNPWWHWLLPVNDNCVLDYFHKSDMVESL